MDIGATGSSPNPIASEVVDDVIPWRCERLRHSIHTGIRLASDAIHARHWCS